MPAAPPAIFFEPEDVLIKMNRGRQVRDRERGGEQPIGNAGRGQGLALVLQELTLGCEGVRQSRGLPAV